MATSMSVPLSPGASLGIGNYVTNISLGTPAASYSMMVDTGSSLTWLQCLPCNISCHKQSGPIFDPAASRSYSTVPCSAPACSSAASATLNPTLCTPNEGVCFYEAGYGDGSMSAGLLSKDTLRTGGLLVQGFFFGCGQANRGLFGRVAGVIGLARSDLSFLSQAKDAVGALAFSYCLPTSSSTGSLSLGPYEESRFSYTPIMQRSPLDKTLYFVKLSQIALGGRPIPVPPSAYDMPTILDSGTVVTRLPPEVYSALSEAVVSVLEKKRYRRAPAYLMLSACFVGQASGVELPQVSLVFEGGSAMVLPTRNVMVDVDRETTCLGFAAASGVAIIGNRQQQTFDVVYDVEGSRIGFAAGGCR